MQNAYCAHNIMGAPVMGKAAYKDPFDLSSDNDVTFVKSVKIPSNRKRTLDLDEDARNAPQPKKRKITKECIICCEERSLSHFPTLCDGPECEHSVCSRCWRKHLAAETESKLWNDIKCPECRKVLQDAEIQVLASEKTYMLCVPIFSIKQLETNDECATDGSTKQQRHAQKPTKSSNPALPPHAIGDASSPHVKTATSSTATSANSSTASSAKYACTTVRPAMLTRSV